MVAKQYGIRPADFKAHGQHAGASKALAIELACRLTGWTHRANGAYYGGISSAAVSVARRRLRERAETDAVERLLVKLTKEMTIGGRS